MKKKNIAKTMVLALSISILQSFISVAGQWQQNETGWWYQNDDGSYPTNTWQWLDGNNDGIAESYYFDSNGYCLQNTTTPDGYTVNADGAWVDNGVVQTQETVPQMGQPTQQKTLSKTKPALKFNTDFIKQEFVDVLGESKEYALQRLADYGVKEDENAWFGSYVYCYFDEFESVVTVYYDTNGNACKVFSLGWGLFNVSEDEETVYLLEEFGEDVIQLDENTYVWRLSQSPYVEIVYNRETVTFDMRYIEE